MRLFWWCSGVLALWCMLGGAVGPAAFPLLLVAAFAFALGHHDHRNGRH